MQSIPNNVLIYGLAQFNVICISSRSLLEEFSNYTLIKPVFQITSNKFFLASKYLVWDLHWHEVND